MSNHRTAAIITIRAADQMTPEGRNDIATWMRKQADFLCEHGDEYSKEFRARYLYKDHNDD